MRHPLSDLDGDSIYTATISDKLYEGPYYEYKFVKVRTASTDWEDNIGGNRNFTVPVGGTTHPVPYFDNDNLVSLPTTANILHTVDMTAYENLGWYRPDLGDSLELRGAPFGWDGNAPNLDPSPGQPGKYEYLQSYSGYTYDQFAMKYYMILEPVSAATRFPLYTGGMDGVAYERPSERGDGNRIYNIGTGGDIIAHDVYFSDIDPRGTLSDVQQVTVTLSVDMTPAPACATPFSPANDTLFLHWQDALWRGSQIASQGAFTDYWPMTNAGGNTWQVTFTVKGKTHYNMQYTYVYRQPGGASVETGTGLGQQNPFYTRFINPDGPNTWPASYTAPTDTWKKSAPLPGRRYRFETPRRLLHRRGACPFGHYHPGPLQGSRGPGPLGLGPGQEGRRLQGARDSAGSAGHVAHEMIAAKVLGREAKTFDDMPKDIVDKALGGYRAFLRWWERSNFELVATEQSLLSNKHRFGGTLDALAKNAYGICILDWKTSKGRYVEYLLQLAAYRLLAEENHRLAADGVAECHLLWIDKETASFGHL